MLSRTPRALLLAASLLVLLAAPAPGALAAVDAPQRGQQIFIDCSASLERNAKKNNPWYWARRWGSRGKTVRAKLVERIAKVPTAKWFAGASIRTKHGRRKMFERYFARVDDPRFGGPRCKSRLRRGHRGIYVGNYPVIALRAMKHDRCKGYDGGGHWNRYHRGSYKGWIDDFVRALQRRWVGPGRYVYWHRTVWPSSYFAPVQRPATVILEPDAVGLMGRRSGCLTKRARRTRFALLRYAAQKLAPLQASGVTTYIDVGSSAWVKPGEAVYMLRKAGVQFVRGFATNSTHFNATGRERAFADTVARRLGKRYVLNTAENGRGSLPKRYWTHGAKSMWCNPRNSGLGRMPSTRTGSPYADAFLWISRPGLSSNGKAGKQECGRGPLDNVWWNARAFQLGRKAAVKKVPWPPKPV